MVFTKTQLQDLEEMVEDSVHNRIFDDSFLDKLAAKLANAVASKLEVKIEEKFNKLIGKLETANKRISSLEKENEELFNKIDKLEQYTRRNSIRIFGVQESENENLLENILDLFNKNMDLSVTPQDVDRCHRTGSVSANKKKPRALIVKFLSYQHRSAVLKNRSKLKGTKVVVKEDLTRNRVEVLKAASERFGRRNVWSYDGTIFVNKDNKKYPLQCMQDLDNIIANNK